MKEESDNLKMVKRTWKKVLMNFGGRFLAKILLMFCRLTVRSLVLAFPVKWLLNDLFEFFIIKFHVDFIVAAEIVLICSFLIRPRATETTNNTDYEDDEEN